MYRLVRTAAALILSTALAAALLAAVQVDDPAAAAAAATGDPKLGFSPGSVILWESDGELVRDFDAMKAAGARWVRLDFDWPSIEPTKGSFNWSHTDRVVTAALDRGMQVLALPTYTPSWARPAGTNGHTPPTNPADFAAFVQAAVQRYAPQGVRHWEIWNEPNLSSFWGPRPDPAAYAALLRAAYPAVHTADPGATVLFGGMAPAVDGTNTISPLTFLTRAYDAGVNGSFDAVAIHPYSFPALPLEPGTDSWNTFKRTPLLHDLMQAKGDGAKQIWATEFGAPTGTGTGAVSEDKQAQIATDAIRAIREWPWAGPLFWYAVRDTGTDPTDREENFGLLRNDFTPKKASTSFAASAVTPATSPVPPTPSAPSATPASPPNERLDGITTISGSDRIETAVAVSQRRESADVVVIATSTNFADALVAGPLAVRLGGPVLLTGRDRLDPRVAAEIRRLGATGAIALGGPAALSGSVIDDLNALGLGVERIAGRDRYITAAEVARRLGRYSTVLVASGERFPDALAAGSLGLPVLLTRRDELPDAARNALTGSKPVLIGGEAAVRSGVVPGALRLAGADRFATSAEVADWGMRNDRYAEDGVVLARGDEYADALVGGALQLPVLLVSPAGLAGSPSTREWLSGHQASTTNVFVLGGSAAIDPSVTGELQSLHS